MRHIFVINPVEGKGNLLDKLEAGENEIRFYACGGDGTVNEVFGGTAGFADVGVGIIPIGTGNDFVKNFGPDEWQS